MPGSKPTPVRIEEVTQAALAGAVTRVDIAASIGLTVSRVDNLISKAMNTEQRVKVLRALEENRTARLGVTAFGETKTVTRWLRDPRCVVPASVLWARLKQYEWDPEEALTTPSGAVRPSVARKRLPEEAVAEVQRLTALASRVRGVTSAGSPNRAAAAARCDLINQLLDSGHGMKQIATETGYTRKSVYLWAHYKDGKDKR